MRKSYLDDVLGEEAASTPKPLPKQKKGGRAKGCVFLFTLQIILLGVWGGLCFVLGMSVQQNGAQVILRDIQTQVGIDTASLSEVIDNPIRSVNNPSVILENGVVIEVVETKQLASSDFNGSLPSADREWWGITFKATNYYTKPVAVNVCLNGITDQDGNSFNCQMIEHFLKNKSIPKKLDAFLIMDPTFSDEAYIIYGFPHGTQMLTWPIRSEEEYKTLVFSLP